MRVRPRTNSSGLVYGTVIQTTTCIAFSWRWLLFPALLIILTAICLVITMVQPIYEKVENPLWKSSILPLLYASPGTQLMASGEAHDMEAKSKVTIARLENSEDKWSFVDISGERAWITMYNFNHWPTVRGHTYLVSVSLSGKFSLYFADEARTSCIYIVWIRFAVCLRAVANHYVLRRGPLNCKSFSNVD